jgi:hypothetical protein
VTVTKTYIPASATSLDRCAHQFIAKLEQPCCSTLCIVHMQRAHALQCILLLGAHVYMLRCMYATPCSTHVHMACCLCADEFVPSMQSYCVHHHDQSEQVGHLSHRNVSAVYWVGLVSQQMLDNLLAYSSFFSLQLLL